jgi:hypothetical protein
MVGKQSRTALRAGVPFGIAMGAIYYAQHRQVVALLGGTIAGLLFGITMAYLQNRGEKRLQRSGLPVEDMTPVQERTISLGFDQELALQKAKEALLAIRKVRPGSIKMRADQISASTGITWQSFGERISVNVQATEAGALVHITSRPRLASTVMDSGKGCENVELFAGALKQ